MLHKLRERFVISVLSHPSKNQSGDDEDVSDRPRRGQ